jgi:hypothetical protein
MELSYRKTKVYDALEGNHSCGHELSGMMERGRVQNGKVTYFSIFT